MIRRTRLIASVLFALLLTSVQPVMAHPSDLHVSGEWTGTLSELLEIFLPRTANAKSFEGPTKPVGISAKTLGKADLTGELPGLDNRILRARLWTMKPGGIVPIHSHVDRPAYIYILEGEVTEHRSDDETPHVFTAGMLSVESGGVVHWWENTGGTTVKMIAIDLFHQK